MAKYAINGKILTRAINGQIRVATEMIRELDKLVDPGEMEIVAPHSQYTIDGLQNIKINRVGKGNPHIWEQTTYYNYLKRNKEISINFLNTHPLLRPDVTYIHDTLFSAFPNIYTSLYGRIQKIYTQMMIRNAISKAKAIITVSRFSKSELIKYYNVPAEKVNIIYNAWQHISRIDEDDSIFSKYSYIVKNNYLLMASGITPQKNFKWCVENAKYNLNQQYVVAGPREKSTQDETKNTNNIFYTGRVTDGELKALMHYCKAFIHPAIYEGFGMTPLEAIASGCKRLILSDIPVMHEIYENSAHYIDPYKYDVNIDDILSERTRETDIILNKYSWHSSAVELLNILREINI